MHDEVTEHVRASPGGTDVTESFTLAPTLQLRIYWALAGFWRGPYNRENMRATLRRLKELAEAS